MARPKSINPLTNRKISLTEEQKERLQVIADFQHTSFNFTVRQAINFFLEKGDPVKEFLDRQQERDKQEQERRRLLERAGKGNIQGR